MTVHPERGRSEPFHLWILHEPKGGSLFTIRYEVYRGMGALRLGGLGAVTPSLKRGRLRGLSPAHLQQGRFLLFSEGDSPGMKEIPVWSAAASPAALPAGEWTLMIPSSQGMTPIGWEEQEPRSVEDCVTDLTARRGLGLAMERLKQRKSTQASQKPSLPEEVLHGAPLGLVRHLQNVIERQRNELEVVRAELAQLRSKGDRRKREER